MSKFLAAISVVMLIVLYFAFSMGFVFYKYWHWFVLDVFPDLPTITFFQAVGLKLFTGILIYQSSHSLKEELYEQDKLHRAIYPVILPWVSIGIGYFIYLFIN